MKNFDTTLSIILLSLTVVVIVSGCANQTAQTPTPAASINHQTFQFSSGGAHHPEGFGEWQVQLNAAETFSVTHNVAGQITAYGPFTLTPAENQKLWQRIDAAQITRLSQELQRVGVPDEVAYTFSLADYSAVIWINDARKDTALMALVDYIKTLIKTYTGENAVVG